VSEGRQAMRQETSISSADVVRDSEGLWVRLPEEAYWFFIRRDDGRQRFVTFERMAP
jgi:hypothetical protein